MARVVVDVMLKPEVLDPQGQAVGHALARMGAEGVTSVRQGKHFEIEVAGQAGPELAAAAQRWAAELLANPVIEDFTVSVE